jgi:hypothetical protein
MMAAATMPRPGAAKGVVPKNGHGDRVLQGWGAGQRRHCEGHGAQRDCSAATGANRRTLQPR